MTIDPSATDVFRHGLRLLLDKDNAGWTGLWHEDGVPESPFAPDPAADFTRSAR
ncbi:hypothetical protein ABTZ03_00220 [Kitasatospora sp. NPDC096077]|uniref:hypothetical protein n=1 Tax=Kitasatospora sp. NPDC096077 TaxID=3155544 RepID=UPI00331E4CFE